jgi:DNA-binding beta-propeller fold protein YncE
MQEIAMSINRYRLFPHPASALLLWCVVACASGQVPALVLERTIPLPGVTGRIDHMDVDVQGNRLFVAALGFDALEVIDLAAGKRSGELRSFHKPQGVRFIPSIKRLFVANGDGGGVVAFGDGALPAVGSAASLDDADNLRFDAAAGALVAGFDQALAFIDPATVRVSKTIALAGHPEAFVIERSGRRIFVNVPTAGHIAVVDAEARTVSAAWRVGRLAQNFPMALDEDDRRLFVVTRWPAQLLVFDTNSGRRVTALSTCGDSDDLFFDRARKQIYVVCGDGFVDVIRQRDPDRYELVARVPTASGARTGFFAPENSALYVAAPARNGNQAEIRVYRVPDLVGTPPAK